MYVRMNWIQNKRNFYGEEPVHVRTYPPNKYESNTVLVQYSAVPGTVRTYELVKTDASHTQHLLRQQRRGKEPLTITT